MNKKKDPLSIPIFIISYNRVSCLKDLIAWLENAKYKNIIIVDNASTYPPLLEFLKETSCKVEYLPQNMGHLAVWKCGLFDDMLKNQYYVVTDCDVIPDTECPLDIVEHCHHLLKKLPSLTKVGPSLRIDNIPDSFAKKQQVVEWESQFWRETIDAFPLYKAPIDTTFALYRPGIYPENRKWFASGRTFPPYQACHTPWYDDTQNPTEEMQHYQQKVILGSSHWLTPEALLRDENAKLRQQVLMLQRDFAFAKLHWTAQMLYGLKILCRKLFKRP